MVAVEDICNQALIEIGYPERIGFIDEGTPAAIAALEIYGQTRDELLQTGDWPIARRANIALALLKGPPPAGGYNPLTPWNDTYPPPGWLYEYLYPADCIDFRAIVPRPGLMFVLDPAPQVWRIDNDNSQVDRNGAAMAEQRVILANAPGALATYIAQVTDPNLWTTPFTGLLVKRLASKLARRLKAGEPVEREERSEEKADEALYRQDEG